MTDAAPAVPARASGRLTELISGDVSAILDDGVSALRYLALVVGLILVVALCVAAGMSDTVRSFVTQNPRLGFGGPGAALVAFVIVGLFRTAEGKISISLPGALKFEGASGPIVMWVMCFLALAAGIRLLG